MLMMHDLQVVGQVQDSAEEQHMSARQTWKLWTFKKTTAKNKNKQQQKEKKTKMSSMKMSIKIEWV